MTKKIEKVAKGNYYETKDHALLVVTNGRLKDEGELGQSFEGKTVTYDAKKNDLVEAKKADRFYLDELVRRLVKKDLEEWIAVEQRETEAAAAAETQAEEKPAKKAKAATTKSDANDGKKLSALDAAAKVLSESTEPLRAKDIIDQMAEKGYWTSPGGKTPHATISAAIMREIRDKGDDSRFKKADRGLFAANS